MPHPLRWCRFFVMALLGMPLPVGGSGVDINGRDDPQDDHEAWGKDLEWDGDWETEMEI